MKRKGCVLLVWLVVVALYCSSAPALGSINEPVSLVWGTASMGSSAQIIGTAIGVTVGKYEPNLKISVQTTGGSLENPRLLHDKKIDIAHTTETYNAVFGVGPFTGEDPKEMWALFNMYSNELVICVLEDSPIKTVEDLVGKRVSTGPAGSGTNQMTRATLEAYGVLDQVKTMNLGYNEAVDALKSGVIDAFGNFTSAGIPSPSLLQFDQTTKYRVLPLDQAIMQKAYDKFPDFAPETITKGSLKALPEDFSTLASFSIELADSRMSDEIAYTMVKTIFDHIDELKVYHQIAGKMALDKALSGIPKGVPIHPGAAKYYKEKGVWRDYLTEGVR